MRKATPCIFCGKNHLHTGGLRKCNASVKVQYLVNPSTFISLLCWLQVLIVLQNPWWKHLKNHAIPHLFQFQHFWYRIPLISEIIKLHKKQTCLWTNLLISYYVQDDCPSKWVVFFKSSNIPICRRCFIRSVTVYIIAANKETCRHSLRSNSSSVAPYDDGHFSWSWEPMRGLQTASVSSSLKDIVSMLMQALRRTQKALHKKKEPVMSKIVLLIPQLLAKYIQKTENC